MVPIGLAGDHFEHLTRLKAAKQSESPTTLLEQLKRIHQQTVETGDGKTLTGEGLAEFEKPVEFTVA